MKKLTALLLALAMLLSLTGCGSMSTESAVNRAEVPEAAGDTLYSSSGAVSGSGTAVAADQKLIKRVTITAETEDLDPLLTSLAQQIQALGGYVESQELYNGSAYSSYRSRSALLVIRIPADSLDRFVEQVQDSSNVVTYNASQENVTLTYVDTESRVKALEVERDRLLELLAQAENLTDMLEIEARLSDVRYELESAASQLRVLSNQVDYATVELSIDQVKVYTEPEPDTAWQRISKGFANNLRDIGEGLVDLFVWVVTYSPQLLFLAVLAAVFILLLRRNSRRKKRQDPPSQPE